MNIYQSSFCLSRLRPSHHLRLILLLHRKMIAEVLSQKILVRPVHAFQTVPKQIMPRIVSHLKTQIPLKMNLAKLRSVKRGLRKQQQ